MERLKSLLENYHKARILDVGTGRADFITLISNIFDDYKEIIGTDISENLIKYNNDKFKDNPRVSFLEDNILETRLEKNSFDIIILSNTLHHLLDIEKTILSMFELLNNEGIIIINEMIADNLNSHQKSHKLLHHFAAKVDRERNITHFETFSKDEIIAILKGFSFLKIKEYWQLNFENNVENNHEMFQNLLNRLLSLVESSKNYNSFVQEAEVISNYIKENNFQSATELLVVLDKK